MRTEDPAVYGHKEGESFEVMGELPTAKMALRD